MVPQDDMWSRDPLAWAGPNAAKVNLAHQTISFSAQRGWASTMTGSFQMILPPLEAYHHLGLFFSAQVNSLWLERKMLVSLFTELHCISWLFIFAVNSNICLPELFASLIMLQACASPQVSRSSTSPWTLSVIHLSSLCCGLCDVFLHMPLCSRSPLSDSISWLLLP